MFYLRAVLHSSRYSYLVETKMKIHITLVCRVFDIDLECGMLYYFMGHLQIAKGAIQYTRQVFQYESTNCSGGLVLNQAFLISQLSREEPLPK